MNFLALEYFVAVAEERSFSQAAKHLFVSQQSVSNQILKLESELDVSLFVRSRPLALTKEGERFIRVAYEMLQLKNQYEKDLQNNIFGSAILRIGIANTTARSILPHILPAYYKRHPNVQVKITEDAPELLQKSVTYDGVDLVIGSISDLPATYKSVRLCSKKQLLIVPKKVMRQCFGSNVVRIREKFAREADLRAFANAPFIRMNKDFSAGRTLQRYLDFYHVRPSFVCELINIDVAFQLAYAGAGLLVYSKLFYDAIEPDIQEIYARKIDVFPLPDLPGLDHICAYYHRDRRLSEEAEDFLNLCKQYFKNYQESDPE